MTYTYTFKQYGGERVYFIRRNNINVFTLLKSSMNRMSYYSLSFYLQNTVASIELICDDRKMQAGFNITELDDNILPYAIRFQGNNKCDVIRAQNSSQIKNGMIWIEAGLADCGINAYITDDEENIVFEQTIVVEYGSMTSNPLIYRYFNDTYNVKCSMDRNITQELNINVKERKTISTEISKSCYVVFTCLIYSK